MNAYFVLIDDVLHKARGRMAGLLVLMLLVGATEGLGTALLFSLLTRLGIAGGAETGTITAGLEGMIEWIRPGASAWFVFGLLSCAAVFQAALFIAQSWEMSDSARRYAADWQVRLFSAFIRADWLFLTERKSGDLVNAVVVETNRVTATFFGFTQIVAAFVITLIYLAVALFVSWQVTLLLIGLAVFMLLSIISLYRTSYRIGRQMGPFNALVLSTVNEYLSSTKIIKASVAEERAIERFANAVRGMQRVSRVGNFIPSLVRGLFEMIGLVGLAALLVIGTSLFHVAPANLLVVLALFVRLLPRLTSIQTQLHNLNTFVPSILGLKDLLAIADSRRERERGSALPHVMDAPLHIDNLRIAYDGRVVVDGLNLNMAIPGFHAIIGGSGAGKSSLMHAIVGLVPAERGTIQLGANRLQDISLASWRRAVALVPQETTLFNATVADNLRIAVPDASMDEVIAVARAANAHDFIMRLAKGYDTFIGDQGVLLSGGQRQRLGIARALLMQPSLLLLDEPTSALDPESEREVLETLLRLRRSIGIVVVAHRLATVRDADTIVVMENGSVAESGTWDKLIGERRRLYDMAQAQHIVMAQAH